MLILLPITDNYSENVTDLGIQPAKLLNMRLGTLQKTGLLNINGLHQLGLLTSE